MDYDGFSEFCYRNNIQITVAVDLSPRIKGYCYYDGNYYNVIVNNKFDQHQLKKTTIHEIIHIMENHFNCSIQDIDRCESEVRRIINTLRLEFSY